MKSNSIGEVDGPGQVGHEHEGALEDADEERRPTRVVGGDLRAHLGDPTLQVVLGDDRAPEVRIRAGLSRRGIVHASSTLATPPGAGNHDLGHLDRRTGGFRGAPRSGRPRRASGARDDLTGHRQRGGSSRRRPAVRATRHPPPTSVATASRRATASTRSTVAASGGWPIVRARAQPGAHGHAGQRRGRRRERGRRRWDRGSLASADRWSARSAGVVGQAGEQRDDIATGDVVEQRQHLVADPVAAVDAGRRWSDRRPAPGPLRAQRARVSARRRPQDRPTLVGSHAGQAVEAGAPQQVEQHGLGLVVGGVARAARPAAAPRSGRPGPGPRGSGPASTSTRSARNAAPNARRPRPHDLGLGARRRRAARDRRGPR